jgi:hypothetical protein
MQPADPDESDDDRARRLSDEGDEIERDDETDAEADQRRRDERRAAARDEMR